MGIRTATRCIVAALLLAALLVFGASPASAEDGEVTGIVAGCLFGPLDVVIDGEFAGSLTPGLFSNIDLDIPEGVPGAVLSINCGGFTEAVALTPGATTCEFFSPPVGSYTNTGNLLCLKIYTAPGLTQDFVSFFWAGDDTAASFDDRAAFPAQALAGEGLELGPVASAVELGDSNTPWSILQVAGAGAAGVAMAAFAAGRRRQRLGV